jgi:hypothetical protein
MYVSTDDGLRWQSLQLNLPVTPVTDLAIHRKDLVVTTQGRGFWILDDLTPLHELTGAGTQTQSRVLAPRDAYRGVSASAIIWYTFDKAPTAPVTVEIRDPSGRLVTRAESRADQAPVRGGPTSNTSLNRFEWNLRYMPPFQVPQGVGLFAALAPGFAGPLAPPGVYDVVVRSGPWKGSGRLTVQPNPGSPATPAQYDEQLTLALRVGARTRTLYEMLGTVRDLRAQAAAIEPQLSGAANEQLRRAMRALDADLTAIQDALAQTRATGVQDTAPSKLDSQFVGLYGRVIAHDGRPTEPEQTRFRDIDPLLTKQEAALDGVIRNSLPPLNELLVARGVPPIRAPKAGA